MTLFTSGAVVDKPKGIMPMTLVRLLPMPLLRLLAEPHFKQEDIERLAAVHPAHRGDAWELALATSAVWFWRWRKPKVT